MSDEFVPKLFTLLRAGIPREQLRRDIIAGIVVGVVALPLAIAFAIASGVPPEKGLITAIIAGFAISAFGGSRVQIGGPTGAFVVIVAGIVHEHGLQGLTIATFMAGALIMVLGFLRAGQLLKYFPHTLVVGFTSGIAVVIFSTQMNALLGLRIAEVPADMIGKWAAYAAHFPSVQPEALVLGATAILLSTFTSRLTNRVPGPLLAIVVCTAIAWVLDLQAETIATRFGSIPGSLPAPSFQGFELSTLRGLVQPAIAIALLGSIESLLSAVVADGMIGGRHRSNMELVAQGGANMLSAIFGGIPATGAIARTATNVKNGGRTPIAGIVHALTLLAIMLVAAPLAGRIPLACLAGILIVVAYNMSEWRSFLSIMRGDKHDVLVLLVTFLLTVFFDLILAIEVGMVLAAFLFMKRMSDITDLKPVMNEGSDAMIEDEVGGLPKDVLVFDINGPLFFGAAQKFQDVLSEINDRHRVVVLRMKNVPLIDATGLHRLKDILLGMERKGRTVYLTDLDPRVLQVLTDQPWFKGRMVLARVQDLYTPGSDRY
jgi:SulP family sulfate permease